MASVPALVQDRDQLREVENEMRRRCEIFQMATSHEIAEAQLLCSEQAKFILRKLSIKPLPIRPREDFDSDDNPFTSQLSGQRSNANLSLKTFTLLKIQQNQYRHEYAWHGNEIAWIAVNTRIKIEYWGREDTDTSMIKFHKEAESVKEGVEDENARNVLERLISQYIPIPIDLLANLCGLENLEVEKLIKDLNKNSLKETSAAIHNRNGMVIIGPKSLAKFELFLHANEANTKRLLTEGSFLSAPEAEPEPEPAPTENPELQAANVQIANREKRVAELEKDREAKEELERKLAAEKAETSRLLAELGKANEALEREKTDHDSTKTTLSAAERTIGALSRELETAINRLETVEAEDIVYLMQEAARASGEKTEVKKPFYNTILQNKDNFSSTDLFDLAILISTEIDSGKIVSNASLKEKTGKSKEEIAKLVPHLSKDLNKMGIDLKFLPLKNDLVAYKLTWISRPPVLARPPTPIKIETPEPPSARPPAAPAPAPTPAPKPPTPPPAPQKPKKPQGPSAEALKKIETTPPVPVPVETEKYTPTFSEFLEHKEAELGDDTQFAIIDTLATAADEDKALSLEKISAIIDEPVDEKAVESTGPILEKHGIKFIKTEDNTFKIEWINKPVLTRIKKTGIKDPKANLDFPEEKPKFVPPKRNVPENSPTFREHLQYGIFTGRKRQLAIIISDYQDKHGHGISKDRLERTISEKIGDKIIIPRPEIAELQADFASIGITLIVEETNFKLSWANGKKTEPANDTASPAATTTPPPATEPKPVTVSEPKTFDPDFFSRQGTMSTRVELSNAIKSALREGLNPDRSAPKQYLLDFIAAAKSIKGLTSSNQQQLGTFLSLAEKVAKRNAGNNISSRDYAQLLDGLR